MPALIELDDPAKLNEFAKQIAINIENLSTTSVDTDTSGLHNTIELRDQLIKGQAQPFDYKLWLANF